MLQKSSMSRSNQRKERKNNKLRICKGHVLFFTRQPSKILFTKIASFDQKRNNLVNKIF